MAQQQDVLSVTVRRGVGEDSHEQRFDVPEQASQTVLDVVCYIQEYLDPTLSYPYCSSDVSEKAKSKHFDNCSRNSVFGNC